MGKLTTGAKTFIFIVVLALVGLSVTAYIVINDVNIELPRIEEPKKC